MKVLVAGAHGKISRHLVRMLTEEDHEVRGLVRKEEQLPDVESDGAEAVLVDLESDEADGKIGEAVEGCDAIIFAAGAGPGSGESRKQTMDYGGAVKLIEAAQERGVRRYMIVSTMGADDPGSRDEKMQSYLEAKGKADERLRESSLDYTIIRPGRLTDDEEAGTVEAAESLGRYGEISRADVARTFAVALEAANTYCKTFEILAGDTPTRKAVEAI